MTTQTTQTTPSTPDKIGIEQSNAVLSKFNLFSFDRRPGLGFWCLSWCLILFALGCFLEDNGPVYPLRVREHLHFKLISWQNSWETKPSTYFISFLKKSISRDLQLNGPVILLGDSRKAARITVGEPPNPEVPNPGTFMIKNHNVLFVPKDGVNPSTDGKDYELYFPPAVPDYLRIISLLLLAVPAAGAIAVWKNRSTAEDNSSKSSDNVGDISAKTQRQKKYLLNAILAFLVLGAAIYVSTGGLTPYNLFGNCIVRIDVPFFTNCDHNAHKGVFDFLSGSVTDTRYLRRILFPALCFPLMKAYGFAVGGVIGSIVLNLLAVALFGVYLRWRYGASAAVLGVWLLATFPGITYFAGLPYLNSFVVPGALAMIALLTELERSTTLAKVAVISLGLGVLNLGYDLLSFFGPVAVMVLLLQKRWTHTLASLPGLLGPTLAWLACLWFFGPRDSFTNENTSSYTNSVIAYSFLKDPAIRNATIQSLPSIFPIALKMYFASAFYFLPALFAVGFLIGRTLMGIKMLRCELFILLAALATFLFLNCSPAYVGCAGWQLKGETFARIYEPIFVVFLSYLVRQWSQLNKAPLAARGLLVVLAVFTVGANALICFGPILNNPYSISSRMYYDFYMQAPETLMQRTLEVFGRRPIGFYDQKQALQIAAPNNPKASAAMYKF